MTINSITVVGAGVMGRGIAYVSALAGFQTTLVDVSQDQLQNALDEMSILANKAVERGKLSNIEAGNLVGNIQTSLELHTAVKSTDFVIEAVPEKRDLKKHVLETVDTYAAKDIVIASNTSTISPTELGSYTKRSEKVAAMHFFNPVHRMRLVEIVKGLETSSETVTIIREVAERMGKETVEVNEFPGFVTSRISAMVGNEAFYMLQEGVATAEDIDKAIKLGLNYPMGPLELGDLVGLDTRLNNLKYLHETLGEKFRPAPLLEQYVKAGRLGRKTGRGVYEYSKDGELIKK
ncbi:3-hydroxyacyl-CoA dehydrogenase [Ornithinibacillus bavariensis]|uniref:3-hydroxybutyryl-CoA dehydrogenase n=1 Tax=Ornithinibacillus bavariensis TaxID=545502 RepID=A0A920C7H4_9BACI|nr:3-hydroxyacyl-CoA dehydrogenase [Ornithinibacillus bavariensis]GIO26697.1 3-hydroxybutyryl-CoA dehydrogenase [Ornithinibacillus bavariensis]